MKRIIIPVVLVVLMGTSYASVQTDVSNIKGPVPPGTPSVGAPNEQKGFVGHLLGEIFELSGHIKNQFIVAFQDIQGNYSNTVPKWNGQKFVRGSITDRSGNVGIGTTNPQTDLDIAGTAGGFARLDGSDGTVQLKNNGTSNTWKINASGTSGETKFYIHDDGDVRLAINQSGRIGIGKTNPQAKLHVDGDIRGNNFYAQSNDTIKIISGGDISNRGGSILMYGGNKGVSSSDIYMRSNGTNRMKIDGSSGNVGIGTSSPQARLHVNGRIIASNPTQNNHVATKGYVDSKSRGSKIVRGPIRYSPSTAGGRVYSVCPSGSQLITCNVKAANNFYGWPSKSDIDRNSGYEAGKRNEHFSYVWDAQYGSNRCMGQSNDFNGMESRVRVEAVCLK